MPHTSLLLMQSTTSLMVWMSQIQLLPGPALPSVTTAGTMPDLAPEPLAGRALGQQILQHGHCPHACWCCIGGHGTPQLVQNALDHHAINCCLNVAPSDARGGCPALCSSDSASSSMMQPSNETATASHSSAVSSEHCVPESANGPTLQQHSCLSWHPCCGETVVGVPNTG